MRPTGKTSTGCEGATQPKSAVEGGPGQGSVPVSPVVPARPGQAVQGEEAR